MEANTNTKIIPVVCKCKNGHKCGKFKQKLLDKYDVPARDKVKDKLKDYVIDNPDIYQQDLIITGDTCKYKYLELQVCCQWVNHKFPFDTPYLYARKAKYYTKDNDTLFFLLNKHMTSGYLFDVKSLENIKPKRIKKYSREFIYEIPWNRCLLVPMEDLSKEIIEIY